MATAIPTNDPQPHPDSYFVGQFALDVILFNLEVCGHKKKPYVVVGYPEIAYSRSNFVRIAAASVLRLCLSYRDKWKPNIKELAKNVSVYDDTFFGKCFSHIVKNALNEKKEALQLNVEITFALATEMALYLISEKRPFDLADLVAATSINIFCLIETPLEQTIKLMTGIPRTNLRQELENLFYGCENILEILGWIKEFIKKYATPYGSTEDVSAKFYQEVGKRWKIIVERVYRGEKPSDEAVKINLGFLPRVAYDTIKAETSVPMPKYSEVAWGHHPEKPSGSSEAGKKSGRRQPTASGSGSKQTAQAGSSGKDASEQAAQAGQGGKDSSEQAAQAGQGGKDSSEQAAQAGQGGKDSSEQAAQGGQTSKDSSDLGLAEAFSEMDLGSERSSQARRGATRKRWVSGKS